ncbi:MAG: hypothetical protein KKA07_00595, partial [Bacteroidetes bacterium]|nr:hypothetical protein [Bacteroidota bacterium]MBU1717549.1 hypothetical protein [Bacteroidota bacterium]
MKIIRLVFLGVICWAVLPLHVAGQNKQGNTTSSEVYADIPWTMIKLDASGKPNSIPVHFYVHDADVLGGTEQLMSITIQIKNATDLNYGPAIRFDTMPINSFRSLFSAKSVANTDLDVQAFDPTAFITSNSVTIDFISDTTSWPFTTYEEITGHIWFFTFNIPSSVLENYDSDIIDFRVYCELDWATDYETELRVFRTNEFPAIPNGWYRGDTHHHCIMTQNTAENGFDLPGTHDAAKLTGLSWITITDHSCDYDNYGVSMQGNWDILGDMVAEVNNSDTTFNFIRGMEVSVANSKGNTVHALIYPPSSNPFGMPYVADGRGDETQGPGVSVPMLLDSMGKYGGFCYAAHPYAEGDVLSIIVSGDVWNLSDPGFPANGQPHPSGGSVVCNDTTQDSDLLSSEPGYFMKNYLLGGEILNEYISMGTTDDPDNPWNTTGDGSVTPFAPLALTDDYHHTRRFKQNLDLVEFVWKKAMHARNTDDNIQNWKYHISAGSDAHGSYNFNNTDQFMGVYGIINDNAVGKLSTLVYCPNGMGVNGTGVLDALRSGHNVLSSGPILTMHIDSDGNPATAEVLPGDDIEIVYEDLLNYNVWFNAQTADLYGDITDIQLIA